MSDSGHHLGAPTPRRPIPEPVAVAVPAVLFGVLDFFVLRGGDRSVGSALGAALAMATFVAVGVWWMRRAMRRLRAGRPGAESARFSWPSRSETQTSWPAERPGEGVATRRRADGSSDGAGRPSDEAGAGAGFEAARAADRVADRPVAGGGWANPTDGQRVFARVARLVRSPFADRGTNPLTGTRPGRKRGQR